VGVKSVRCRRKPYQRDDPSSPFVVARGRGK